MSSKKETKLGSSKLPLLTNEERNHNNARGFYIVTSTKPLPAGHSAYKLVVNQDTVISKYKERKMNGAGSTNMLDKRNLTGNTIVSLVELFPPKHSPVIELEVSSGSIVCYLEDSENS